MKLKITIIYNLSILIILSCSTNLYAAVTIEAEAKNLGPQLFEAVKKGNKDEVEELIKQKANVNYWHEYRDTTLSMAVKTNNKEIVKLLIDNGADVNFANEPALVAAVQKGPKDWGKEIVQLLLNSGANINIQGIDGYTALMAAARNGHEDTIKLLLDAKADPNIKSYNTSALESAIDNGNLETVKRLISAGAVVREGNRPLVDASSNGHKDIVKFFIERGDDVNIPDVFGWTPLSAAAVKGNKDVVQLLLQAGADLDKKNKYYNNQTALDFAKDKSDTNNYLTLRNRKEVVKLIEAEPVRRNAVVKARKEQIAKELSSTHLPIIPLVDIVTEYADENYKDIPLSERLSGI